MHKPSHVFYYIIHPISHLCKKLYTLPYSDKKILPEVVGWCYGIRKGEYI